MKTNAAGIALLKSFEGCVLHAYPDPATGGDPWTIGYGHTSAAGDPHVAHGMTVTQAEAEAILVRDLGKFETYVSSMLKVPVNENQFSAMVSLCYNIGMGNFKTSSVLRFTNSGYPVMAANSFKLWNRGNHEIMPGLVKRRAAEADLYMTKVPAAPAVPGKI